MSKHCKGVSEETTTRILKSAIGRRAKVCKVLGWCHSASGLQMRRKTQVFRLLRTRSFSASHLRSNLSAVKARSWAFSLKPDQADVKLHPANRDVLCSAHRAVWSDRRNAWANVVTHSIRHVIKKSAIVDKATVDAQDARVKKWWSLKLGSAKEAVTDSFCSTSEQCARLQEDGVAKTTGFGGWRSGSTRCHDRIRSAGASSTTWRSPARLYEANVCERVTRIEIATSCRTSWRKHARKGTMNLLRMQQLCSPLGKVLALSNSWWSSCHSSTRLPLRSVLKQFSTHPIRRTSLFRKNGRGLKVCCLSSSLSPSESSKRRMLRKMQRKKRSSSLRGQIPEVAANGQSDDQHASMTQNSRVEDSVSRTASAHQSQYRSSPFPHTSSEFWKQEQLWLSTFDEWQFDLEQDICSGGARASNRSLHVWSDSPIAKTSMTTILYTGDDTGGDYTAIGSGTTCGPYTLVPCAHYVKPFTEYQECSSYENSTPSLFACSESSYLKAYRDDKQRTSAAYSLSAVTGIQQVSRSRQRSRWRSGALRIDQIVDTNRSRRGVGAQLYIPRLLEIVERRPVYVRLALWFLHHPA